MASLPTSVAQALRDTGREDIETSIETGYKDLIEKRVEFITYGDPETLTDRQRAQLNCALLKQVLIYRAERLVVGERRVAAGEELLVFPVAGDRLIHDDGADRRDRQNDHEGQGPPHAAHYPSRQDAELLSPSGV